jgi:hypothetical protein
VLDTFAGTGINGEFPQANLIRDRAGNLYSTTHGGGDLSGNSTCTETFGFPGFGVVFKVDPAGKETVVYAFTGVPALRKERAIIPKENDLSLCVKANGKTGFGEVWICSSLHLAGKRPCHGCAWQADGCRAGGSDPSSGPQRRQSLHR